ncbi:MAG: dihydrolipoyl dehydrogenase [Chlamydiae bacterium]|jgi:dihydrolipoamide dehydrogenase|nr:dihydrolipoyl dehydrogenase [Chlamydiota bacterium]
MAKAFDVLVIGSGPAGYVAAIRCAQLGLSTACVEKSPFLGGTCLNVGCIPSKTLLHSTEMYYKNKYDAKKFGVNCTGLSVDFPAMLSYKTQVVKTFQQGIEGLFQKNKITKYIGSASFLSSTSVEIDNGSEKTIVEARFVIIATGSEPISLPFLPFDQKRIISSTEALSLEKIPKKLVVIGAGAIGIELGSVYNRLGTEVVFIEFLDRICAFLDEPVSVELQKILEKQGMQFFLSSKVTKGEVINNGVQITALQKDDTEITFDADLALVAIGRKPYTQNLGLEKIGVLPNKQGRIEVDGQFRTGISNIFAIGDVIDGPMLAHKGSEEGVVVAELIAGQNPTLDYITIPNVVYSYPEVATVGLTEQEVKKLGIEYYAGTFPFMANSRAKCIGEEKGFVKIIGDKASDRILGMHIISAHASELIAVGVVAIKQKMTLTALAHTPMAHPTLAEAIKEAALAAQKRAIHR